MISNKNCKPAIKSSLITVYLFCIYGKRTQRGWMQTFKSLSYLPWYDNYLSGDGEARKLRVFDIDVVL